jgi:GntR family transcriptional regulator, rspAB operon transcriptional repressor
MIETPSFPQIHYPKISEVSYDLIKEKITSKEFAPGTRLNLDAIEKQLGISRTPLKQALDRLALEGLVEILPRSGTFVSNPSPEEISESFEVRCALEIYAVGLAAQWIRAEELENLKALLKQLQELFAEQDLNDFYPRYVETDHLFHHQIIVIARNKRLLQAFEHENVHAQMARIRYRHPEGELELVQEEHERILAALAARDTGAARLAMEAHLQRARRSLMKDIHKDLDELTKTD